MFDPTKDPPTTMAMTKTFARLTLPAVMTNISAFLTLAINFIFAGRLDDKVKLAAVGLG